MGWLAFDMAMAWDVLIAAVIWEFWAVRAICWVEARFCCAWASSCCGAVAARASCCAVDVSCWFERGMLDWVCWARLFARFC